LQRIEKPRGGIDRDERDIVVAAEQLDALRRLGAATSLRRGTQAGNEDRAGQVRVKHITQKGPL